MKRAIRSWKPWAIAAVLLAVAAAVVSLVVLASQGEGFTATPYADVVRFEAQGVASLQVQILDLSGRSLWDSGVVPGSTVDWDRTNTWGERLAYGAYVYNAQGWNSRGALVFQRNGKLALMPGDKVQLQQASRVPEAVTGDAGPSLWPRTHVQVRPMAVDQDRSSESWAFKQVGIGTTSPTDLLNLYSAQWNPNIRLHTDRTSGNGYAVFHAITRDSSMFFGSYLDTYTSVPAYAGKTVAQAGGGNFAFSAFEPGYSLEFYAGGRTASQLRMWVDGSSGNVGIGTSSPAGRVDVRNTSSQPALRIESSGGTNLIEAYNTGSGTATGLVFRVERSAGHVRADGSFYGAGFHTGSADVAEHVDASETLEPGDVVEIDPARPGFFRKSQDPASRLVAGVISTQPGVVLGSPSIDYSPLTTDYPPPAADHLPPTTHSRPLLALAGCVPVKATTENGPIAPGDILISASKPGYAMRCGNPHAAVGMVIGKALESIDEGDALILIQVTLR